MHRTTIRLEGLVAPVKGQVWESDQYLSIGRLPNMDIYIPHSSLSRLHAELTLTERGWVVRDLGSTNGTYLNSERLGRAGSLLKPNSLLQIGEIVLSVTDIRSKSAPNASDISPRALVQHAALHTWEELPVELLPPQADLAAFREVLGHVGRIGRTCDAGDTVESYLSSVLWRAAEILDARQGTLFLLDPDVGIPKVQVTFIIGYRAGEREWLEGKRLADLAFVRGQSLLFEVPEGADDRVRSVVAAVLRAEQRKLGVLCLARWDGQKPFTESDLNLADVLALATSHSIESLIKMQEGQEKLFLKTLTLLTQLIQFRDDRVGNHGQRVTDYTLLLADQLSLPETEKAILRIGAPLHDIGKIGMKDCVLDKSEALTPEEQKHVRDQIRQSASLIELIPRLFPIIPIVRNSHEHWDGSGYPDGLAGDNIPLLSRIVGIADAFDSMTTDQPYRAAMPPDKALAELERRSGTQFDPNCVQAFLRLRHKLEEAVLERQGVTQTMSVTELRKLLQGTRSAETAGV